MTEDGIKGRMGRINGKKEGQDFNKGQSNEEEGHPWENRELETQVNRCTGALRWPKGSTASMYTEVKDGRNPLSQNTACEDSVVLFPKSVILGNFQGPSRNRLAFWPPLSLLTPVTPDGVSVLTWALLSADLSQS